MLGLPTLFHTFYIKPTERGLLFHRSDFKHILTPGTYRYFGPHWNVKRFDVQQAQLQVENLEFLLQEHRDAFAQHCEIVRTNHNEAALIELGSQWFVVRRQTIAAFWRGWNREETLTVHRFNLDESLELPPEIVAKVKHVQGMASLKFIHIPENQAGFLYRDADFLRVLMPGDYGFWNFEMLKVQHSFRLNGIVAGIEADNLLENHAELVADRFEAVTLSATEVAIVRLRGNAIDIVEPGGRKLYWQGVAIEAIDTQAQPQLPPRLIKELVLSKLVIRQLSADYWSAVEVPPQHVGLYYESGVFTNTLEPGWHAWWTVGRSIKTEVIDLRLQVLEVSGQEILSKDKVALRLNLTASYRITDPVQAKAALKNIEEFLYKELQFALRGAVGTKTLDNLLEDKGAIDAEVLQYIQEKTADYGLTILSVGVKDIILPGDMKTILAQVVEAEKSSQANLIRRREETAATRSMLNTARVMENNPMAQRLKEMEVLERIAEKVNSIEVHGGLNSLLSDLIRIQNND